MTRDARGHHLSGATEAAVAAYDQAVRACLEYFAINRLDVVGLGQELAELERTPIRLP